MFSSFFSIAHIEPETRSSAKQQVAVILSISFLPLILGVVVIAYPTSEDDVLAFWATVRTVFLDGQLYFYAMSACAHIVFLACWTERRQAGGMRVWSVVFALFCTGFMAVYIGQGESRHTIFHGIISVFFLLCAVFLNYRVLVLSQQAPPNPEDVHRGNVEALTKTLDAEYE